MVLSKPKRPQLFGSTQKPRYRIASYTLCSSLVKGQQCCSPHGSACLFQGTPGSVCGSLSRLLQLSFPQAPICSRRFLHDLATERHKTGIQTKHLLVNHQQLYFKSNIQIISIICHLSSYVSSSTN